MTLRRSAGAPWLVVAALGAASACSTPRAPDRRDFGRLGEVRL